MAGSDDEIPPPPPQTPTQQAPHTVSTIKLPILKKARERERKARTTLLMALPEDHLAKFHKMTDAKDMWDAIKSIFGGNDESKKMQKYILKQQFEGFSVSPLKMPIRSSLGLYLLPGPNTSSTNDVSTAYGVSTSSGYNSQRENSSSYTDELMYSFFTNQSSGPHLDHEDLEQLDEFDLEEMDLKWQVAMISMRLKKFYKRQGNAGFDAKEPVGFDKTKVECYNCHKKSILLEEGRSKDEMDITQRTKKETWNTGGNLSFGKLLLGKVLIGTDHARDDKTDVLTYHKKLLAEAVKEKEELKTKLENFQSSFKGLSKLLNSQMSKRDKSGLGYGDQVHDGVLSYENEVFESAFNSRSSDVEDSPVHDRCVNVEGMHAVPPPMTGNYMPLGPDREIDDSMFTYGPKHFSHLIRDCDFHEKRIAKQVELNKKKGKGTGQGENRPLVSTSATRKVNADRPLPARVKAVSVVRVIKETIVKPSAGCNCRPKIHYWNKVSKYNSGSNSRKCVTTEDPLGRPKPKMLGSLRETISLLIKFDVQDDPQKALKNKGIVNSGCSRHMTRNKAYLIKTIMVALLLLEEVKQFNLFSVSQMCDKKNKVLFTDSECLVLSPDFKLPDENQVLLRVPRQNNMYSFNLENIVPTGGLACLIAKATVDESNKWHRRLGHVNFKNLNKLVKGNLVRGLPSKIFQNDHTCVACQKGKQHKASCKAKVVSSISQPLQLLHMDLFGPTSVRSINHKTYCLVITDDFSRFSWVFFLRTKDETSGILKDFIRQIENQLNQKVKTIRCDNGTEFKNRDIIEFYGSKGIKREYSNARTLQQNGVVKRKNRTLIKAARTMLADSFLPNTFLAQAVSTACYVLNRPITAKNKANKTTSPKEANHSAGTQDNIDAGNSKIEAEPAQEYFVLPLWSSYTSTIKSSEAKNGGEKPNGDTGSKTHKKPVDQNDQAFLEELERLKRQENEANDAAEAFIKEFAQFSTANPSRVFSAGGPSYPDLTNNDQDDS
ncbi:putative ribonuclease H-like domain-containing protein [Tanacetum coccineum]|uniref:Ribonuclease H-like domain-containing protein n=1 Tax=Tanacetum coccineum TaxID=301880 RepID=A0ABQ4WAX3_9ASTR